MCKCVYLGLLLLMATSVWAQLGATLFEMPTTSINETPMQTPPPVSAEGYPTVVGSQIRANYLAAGLVFNTAYNDDVLSSDTTIPISDLIYTISPTITLNQTTPQRQLAFTYSPGFTFYQHSSALNAANQNAALNFQYHLSQYTTLSLRDSFQKSTNVFDKLDPLSDGSSISGSSSQAPVAAVAPFADQLSNTANIGISHQFSRNGMIGAIGIVTENDYPNPAQAAGLYNSNSLGGSAFYSHRLSNGQYIGVTYQYLRSKGSPVNTEANSEDAQIEVQTHTLMPFYTIYLNSKLSVSLSSGPQYFDAAESTSPAFRSWAPSAIASVGWQRSHTNIVASYSRTVTGSVGLPGAFNSNNANASVSWQIARTWTVVSATNYSINKNVTPSLPSSSPGGHSISGTVSVKHPMGEHFNAELGYARLHQSYTGIALITAVPDSNREFVSVSYQLSRPMGR